MGKSQQVWSWRTILLNRLQGLMLSFWSGPTSEAQPARPCLHGLANLSAFISTTPHLSCFKAATKLQIPVSKPPWSHLSKGCFLAKLPCACSSCPRQSSAFLSSSECSLTLPSLVEHDCQSFSFLSGDKVPEKNNFMEGSFILTDSLRAFQSTAGWLHCG